eukprot:CAMPEP_0201660574 /NCGR_PEP_ID=MMETSP0494-20130426/3201_1 /ASSEMBLY_ACC=CAM_ASM_000839 /TAXON_ID=420259 /ORGANISM="Thalassiosira gravida, Strain GMp14c1" /LENGTH=429 /DNA_ID=CAMNT_0048138499 /DNA_START=43 /DNA_END=1332 /DNA_ORIENTATION=+
MNTSDMNVLARLVKQRDQGNGAALTALRLRSSLRTIGDTKLSDPYPTPSMAASRRVSMPMMASSSSINLGSTDNDMYLSLLNQQQRSQSAPDHISFRAAMDGIAALTSAPTIAPMAVESQAQQPASAVSAAEYASMVQSQFDSTVTAPSRRRKPNFAEKLHLILNSNECRHSVAWLPSGRSFCITDQDEFVKKILPKFFREAKFESFSRRLKRWGFRKVYTTGMSQIIFSHDLFHRDRPDLCKVMNGREKVVQGQENKQAVIGNPSTTSPFSTQKQLRNAVMFRQTQQQQLLRQVSFQQQIGQQSTMLTTTQPQGHSPSRVGSLQNSISSVQSLMALRGSSPEKIDAQAMINMANALQAKPIPQASNSQLNSEECGPIYQANIQLNRLNNDIANCEEQLAILQRLKGLKATHRQLAGACSPRGISPSSV